MRKFIEVLETSNTFADKNLIGINLKVSTDVYKQIARSAIAVDKEFIFTEDEIINNQFLVGTPEAPVSTYENVKKLVDTMAVDLMVERDREFLDSLNKFKNNMTEKIDKIENNIQIIVGVLRAFSNIDKLRN